MGDDGGYSSPRHPRKAPGWLSRIGRLAVAFVYPTLCPACRQEVAEEGGLCSDCWRDTSFISGAACFTCGAPISGGLGAGAVCDACAHAPPAWSEGAAAVVYDGAGRRLVLSLKHADRLDIAPVAAGWMLRAGRRLVDAADVIAPAPMHWRRLLKRRYNQAGELARELTIAADARDKLALDLLTRTRATETQDGKSRTERYANLSGVVALRRPIDLTGKRVLLIDDVLTTGATLSACAEACRDAGAEDVNVLALARVAREGWPT